MEREAVEIVDNEGVMDEGRTVERFSGSRPGRLSSLIFALLFGLGMVGLPGCADDGPFDEGPVEETVEEVQDETEDAADEIEDELDDSY